LRDRFAISFPLPSSTPRFSVLYLHFGFYSTPLFSFFISHASLCEVTLVCVALVIFLFGLASEVDKLGLFFAFASEIKLLGFNFWFL